MPTYEWKCETHGNWDVSVRIAERDDPQPCPTCGTHGVKQLSAPNIDKSAAGGWNSQSYNPGLGCWTKNSKHASQIAKSRGLVEVGNEPVENIQKAQDKARAETAEKRWQEATSEASIRDVLG